MALGTIIRAINENQQNVINLTQPDYDPSPISFSFDLPVTLKKTITVRKQTAPADVLVWGSPTQGNWGEKNWGTLGFVLGHPNYGIIGTSTLGSNLTSPITIQQVTTTNYNDNGMHTMVTNLMNVFQYLAYGSGSVSDNATSLSSEDGRIQVTSVDDQTTKASLQFILDENTNNGNLISELGLAEGSTGDISATEQPVNIDKNKYIYLIYYIYLWFKNFK